MSSKPKRTLAEKVKDMTNKSQDDNSSSSSSSETTQSLKNEIETLKSEAAKTADPNAKPRTITKGNQTHPIYKKNNDKIAAILPKNKK